MTSSFTFTTSENDLIILGVSNTIRTNMDGSTTNISINNYGNNAYSYSIIRNRIFSSPVGITDLSVLYTNNKSILQSTYPQIYLQFQQSTNTTSQITSTTIYNV